jgi:hypothetical protein
VEELVQSYLRSVRDLLVALGADDAAALKVASRIHAGIPDAGLFAEFYLEKSAAGLTGARASLNPLLDELAELTPRVKRAELDDAELERAAWILTEIGLAAEALDLAFLAYNFHEFAYELLAAFDRPALHGAEKLRQLSDPQKIDQYHAAIWKLAIERLRHACDQQADWLPALDAIELALTCPVPWPEFQQVLFERLSTQISRMGGTPIEGLAAIVTLQAPPSAVTPEERGQVIMMLASAGRDLRPPGPDPMPPELRAHMEAQAMLEDMRLKLLPREASSPRLNAHDLTLHHQRLTDAVPLGMSLIADPQRTARLIPEMAHEIGHAVVLQGALGVPQAIYRAVVTYCEFMLQCEAPGASETMPLDRLAALAELSGDDSARAWAGIQLAAAEKAAVERAVWRPWLEGVSIYIELLGDPKDDPSQISPVHDCMRSLIDFKMSRRKDEGEQAFAARIASEIIPQFETFVSATIARQSRLNHMRYFTMSDVGTPAREIYCLGYLLVRSIVAAWERTMGRPVPPGVALKLLINATQAGTVEALPDPLHDIAGHRQEAQRRHLAWLGSLAALGKEELEVFFQPTPPDAGTARWIWRDGHVHPDPDGGAIAALQEKRAREAEQQVAALAGLDPMTADDDRRLLLKSLRGILARQLEWNRLLPIGSDRARLLFLSTPGLVGLMVRTYGGDAEKAAAAGTAPNAAQAFKPRYNTRFWYLEGGEAEADRLRQAFGRAGTARVHVTRIVDLVGHRDAPRYPDTGSYICAFLPPDFSLVVDGLTKKEITQSHPDFARLLASRLFPPVAYPNEEATIASLAFLGERAQRSRCNPPSPASPSDDSLADLSRSIAFHGAALAFAGGSVERFQTAYEAAMQARAYRVGISNLLYASGRSLPLPGDFAADQRALKGQALSKLVFGTAACSAVTPFGGMS